MHGHNHASHFQASRQGTADASLPTSRRGIRAVKISFAVLALTALVQIVIVGMSGSVALLADTVHNIGDAATAIPLWIAFALGRRRPDDRFPYGYGRSEDLAGLLIVLIILSSAVVAGSEAVVRLFAPRPVRHLAAVTVASIAGFLGNEIVALYRIRVGRAIGSAALVADGYHARVDGLTSLAVLAGTLGVALGFPLADPLVGLGITMIILWIVWRSGKDVVTRMLDGVEPGAIEDLRAAAAAVPGVREVAEVRARWVGHRLHAKVNLFVDPALSVAAGHDLALEVRRRLMKEIEFLARAAIHLDPFEEAGECPHGEGNVRPQGPAPVP